MTFEPTTRAALPPGSVAAEMAAVLTEHDRHPPRHQEQVSIEWPAFLSSRWEIPIIGRADWAPSVDDRERVAAIEGMIALPGLDV